jgi:hypothetical protein
VGLLGHGWAGCERGEGQAGWAVGGFQPTQLREIEKPFPITIFFKEQTNLNLNEV